MGSHSVTCNPTEVKFPPLPQPKLVLDLATPEGCKAELTWVVCWWLLQIPNPLFDLAGITCGHFLVPFGTFFGATLIGKAVIKMHIQVSSLSMVLLYIFKRLIKVMFWRWIFTFLFSNAKRLLAMCKKFEIWRLKQLLDRLSATWLNCTSVSSGWIWFPINESLRYWSELIRCFCIPDDICDIQPCHSTKRTQSPMDRDSTLHLCAFSALTLLASGRASGL